MAGEEQQQDLNPGLLTLNISFYHSGQPPHVALWERTRLPVQKTQEVWVQFLGQEDALEKEMATHSSILAWKIPWTEDTGRLQSMGSQKSQTRLK